jgi:glycosyltransferase involved in cell wall biosynthesis
MNFKYILTTPNFFQEGPCGRVSHAKGFVEGLADNHQYVTLVSGTGSKNFIKENTYINFKQIHKFYLFYFILELYRSILKKEIIIIRWRPFLPFIFIFFAIFYKNIYFELNSVTGLDSKKLLIRKIVLFSLRLSVRFFKVIVVSEVSKQQILSLVNKYRSIYVMPNGFSAEGLAGFKSKHNINDFPNLVYFGRKQDYYEWKKLYNIVTKNPKLNLHIFGFDDNFNQSNIKFYGEFTHTTLIERMREINNPILIIHPDDSDTAKSGSPMKLFEYAYLNLPVIVGDSLQEVSKDFEEFLFYKSGSEESLKTIVEQAVENYPEIYVKSQRLRTKVEVKYSWEKIVRQWLIHEAN